MQLQQATIRRPRVRWAKILAHTALAAFSLYILLPLLWVLRTSLVPETQAYSAIVFPALTFDNYLRLFEAHSFGRTYLNSFLAAGGSTAFGVPIAAMTGYAFARFRTGGQATRFVVLATQMLPPVALVLPIFTIFRAFGLTNSVFGIGLAYVGLNFPFMTWILMGFFEGVPVELEWAGMVDGATRWTAFWRLVVPVAAPGIAAASVLGFILAWNEFLFALILSGPTSATIPVTLAGLQSQNGVLIAEISAGVILGIVPLVVASRFIQRYLVRGLTFGAVK